MISEHTEVVTVALMLTVMQMLDDLGVLQCDSQEVEEEVVQVKEMVSALLSPYPHQPKPNTHPPTNRKHAAHGPNDAEVEKSTSWGMARCMP